MAAFQRLKPHEQFIVNLRVVDGLPFGEIALIVNSTEGAVGRACSRAIDRLRTQFESMTNIPEFDHLTRSRAIESNGHSGYTNSSESLAVLVWLAELARRVHFDHSD